MPSKGLVVDGPATAVAASPSVVSQLRKDTLLFFLPSPSKSSILVLSVDIMEVRPYNRPLTLGSSSADVASLS